MLHQTAWHETAIKPNYVAKNYSLFKFSRDVGYKRDAAANLFSRLPFLPPSTVACVKQTTCIPPRKACAFSFEGEGDFMKDVATWGQLLIKSPSKLNASGNTFSSCSWPEKDAVLRGKRPASSTCRSVDGYSTQPELFESRAEWRQPLPGG